MLHVVQNAEYASHGHVKEETSWCRSLLIRDGGASRSTSRLAVVASRAGRLVMAFESHWLDRIPPN